MFVIKESRYLQTLQRYTYLQAAAKYSGYKRQYLRRLLRKGKIGGMKIGQMWLVEIKALDAYIQMTQQVKDRRFSPKI